MTGSAATFGFSELSVHVRSVEQILKLLMKPGIQLAEVEHQELAEQLSTLLINSPDTVHETSCSIT